MLRYISFNSKLYYPKNSQFLSNPLHNKLLQATRTLKMLYANHSHKGKELQRRLSIEPQASPRKRQGQLPINSQSSTNTSESPTSSSPSHNQGNTGQPGRQNSSSAAHRLHKQQQQQLQKLQSSKFPAAHQSSPLVPKDYSSSSHRSFNGTNSNLLRSAISTTMASGSSSSRYLQERPVC